MIRHHYPNVMSREDAQAFYAILPRSKLADRPDSAEMHFAQNGGRQNGSTGPPHTVFSLMRGKKRPQYSIYSRAAISVLPRW